MDIQVGVETFHPGVVMLLADKSVNNPPVSGTNF
jgi:hypothetical protein